MTNSVVIISLANGVPTQRLVYEGVPQASVSPQEAYEILKVARGRKQIRSTKSYIMMVSGQVFVLNRVKKGQFAVYDLTKETANG